MADTESVARRLIELTDAADWAGREGLLTEDCEMVTPTGAFHGPAATTAFSQGFLGEFADARHRLDVVAVDGDIAALEGVWSATHVASGKRAELPFASTVRTEGGLVRWFHVYFDVAGFIAQLTPPAPDHKETIRRMFEEVINLGKIDVIDELFHPDFESVTQLGTFDRDGFRAFVEGWRAGFADVHCEVSDVIAEGDHVAWKVRATGTNTGDFMGQPATGRSVDFDSLNIGEFRDGQAYRHTVIMDIGRMMAQLAG